MMITLHNVYFSYGSEPVFEGINIRVRKHEKVGIVGINGAGKSTLFRLLLKQEEPRDGQIIINGSIGWVPQEVKRDPDLESARFIREYLDPAWIHQDHEMLEMLAGMEWKGVDLYEGLKELSGGQKTKLALTRALLSKPDLLLLDEPTNFMDVEGTAWVMDFLSNYSKALMVISHDLQLMDKAIDKVFHVNHFKHQIDEYRGNYSAFERLRKEREDYFERQVRVQAKHIARMEEGIKNLYRNKSEKGVRQRIQLKKRIEQAKASLPSLPPALRKITLELPEPVRVGELPIRCQGLEKRFGEKRILQGFDFSLRRGERVAVLGTNGAGKSTLIKCLLKKIEPDSGEVYWDSNLVIGYYSQEFEGWNLDQSLMDAVRDTCKQSEGWARPFLGRFNFPGDKVNQRISSLSGGEKTRLAIALLAGAPSNVLVLDEPTTHLDVLSQRVILESLKAYQGSIIFVSHTEEFVREMTPDRAILMPENMVQLWDNDLLDRVGKF